MVDALLGMGWALCIGLWVGSWAGFRKAEKLLQADASVGASIVAMAHSAQFRRKVIGGGCRATSSATLKTARGAFEVRVEEARADG